MNRIEKLMKALPEGADAALITSDVNRRYFTGLGSTAGTLLAFRDAAYFIIDFRYIEVAKATVTGAEVILQDKLYDQLGELLKKHGARTVALETDYITVGSLEQYRSRLPQVEFLTAAALNDKILEMRSLKDEEEIAAIRKAQSITDAAFLEILDFIKPGKGAAFVRTKIRNVITGAVTERTFNPSDKYPTAYIERKDMEYLYSDGDLYYFMDQETYENIPINKSILSDNFKFVKENTVCKILSYKGSVFGVEPPFFMELEVTKTDPGFAGNTATNTLKPATLETGAEIKVPLFINEGDMIRVDTRTGEYMERA